MAHVEQGVTEEGGGGDGNGGDEARGGGAAAAQVEHEGRDGHVLGQDQGRLAVGAKGEAVAHVVREGDEVGGRLERVGQERDPRRRPRPHQPRQLRQLHHRRRRHDAQPQALGHGQPQALGVT